MDDNMMITGSPNMKFSESWPNENLMGLQSEYDMQTAKNDKSFAARLRNVRKLVSVL